MDGTTAWRERALKRIQVDPTMVRSEVRLAGAQVAVCTLSNVCVGQRTEIAAQLR